MCVYISINSESPFQCPGPTVIKLFESENVLKCQNRLHNFIETLCLNSNNWKNPQRFFEIILYRYH